MVIVPSFDSNDPPLVIFLSESLNPQSRNLRKSWLSLIVLQISKFVFNIRMEMSNQAANGGMTIQTRVFIPIWVWESGLWSPALAERSEIHHQELRSSIQWRQGRPSLSWPAMPRSWRNSLPSWDQTSRMKSLQRRLICQVSWYSSILWKFIDTFISTLPATRAGTRYYV